MSTTTVVPNGTFSGGSTDPIGAATHHEATDESVDSSDGDTTYVQGGSGEVCQLNLQNMPSDFSVATAVTIRARARRTSDKGDVGILASLRIYESDGSTAITDASSNVGLTTSYATYESIRTITGATSKTAWDGAILSFTCNGGANTVRVSAIEALITYTPTAGGGGSTISKTHKMLLGMK